MNKGKNFEHQFKLSAEKDGLFILRLSDSSLSWQHERTSKFCVENPCDFLLFYRGHLFPFELKSTEYKSMSIQMEAGKKAMIKMHQWNSLSNFGLFEDVEPGLILNFREKDSVEEKTYWVPIEDFIEFISTTDKVSINRLDIVQMPNSIIMEQTLKRTNYLYGVKQLLDKIIDQKGGADGKTSI